MVFKSAKVKFFKITSAGIQCESKSYNCPRICNSLAGDCSERIDNEISCIKDSQSVAKIGVSSVNGKLFLVK
jgi:hypothetical protein